MKLSVLFFTSIFATLLITSLAKEREDSSEEEEKETGWWSKFKQRVKSVLSKWRDDVQGLWDEVLAKADDMRHWSVDMFESFKKKMSEWLESRDDVPEKEKNDVENFISKLKVSTEKPKPTIDP